MSSPILEYQELVKLVETVQCENMITVEVGCWIGDTLLKYIDIVKRNNGKARREKDPKKQARNERRAEAARRKEENARKREEGEKKTEVKVEEEVCLDNGAMLTQSRVLKLMITVVHNTPIILLLLALILCPKDLLAVLDFWMPLSCITLETRYV